ncbi:MAG: PRC-barrel domain-containing protein [Sphingobium sp.]
MTETETKPTEAHLLISSDRVEGTAVYNSGGDRLGTVSSLMINKMSGQVEYAIMSFGGLFGIGSEHYPLPWEKLDYDPDKHGYVVDLDRETLLGAPSYAADNRPEFDQDYYRGINAFYGFGVW